MLNEIIQLVGQTTIKATPQRLKRMTSEHRNYSIYVALDLLPDLREDKLLKVWFANWDTPHYQPVASTPGLWRRFKWARHGGRKVNPISQITWEKALTLRGSYCEPNPANVYGETLNSI
jgi:hypothetical protein